jgi:hypothetical protein
VEELFDVPEEERELWLAVLPQFWYGLDDLTKQREEALRARAAPALVKLVLLVLVYGRSAQLAQRMPGWKALFDEAYESPNGEEEVTVLFHYLVRVAAKENRAVMVDILESLVGAQRTEELMGTLAEELIGTLAEKYFENGRVKGRVEGRAEGLLRILELRGVSVDPQARQRILSCTDLATLERWLERAVNATHVSEVLDGSSPS